MAGEEGLEPPTPGFRDRCHRLTPRGANYAKLFLSVTTAFDSAIEEAPGEPSGDVVGLLKLLARMSPEDWAGLQSYLLDILGESAEDDNLLESEMLPMDDPRAFPSRKRNAAMDQPPDFPGKPRTGGKMVPLKSAMDGKIMASDADYFDRLARPHRTAAEQSFKAMFPEAAHIKVS